MTIPKRLRIPLSATGVKTLLALFVMNFFAVYGIEAASGLLETVNGTLGGFLLIVCGGLLLCQPWALLCFAVAYGLSPATLAVPVGVATTSLCTLIALRLLLRTGRLDRFIACARDRRTGIAAAVCLVLVALVTVSEYKDVLPRRSATDATDRQTYHPMQWNGLFPGPSRLVLYREHLPGQVVKDQMRALGMKRIAAPQTLPAAFASQPPIWWRPRVTLSSQVYVSPKKIDDIGGTYALYDPETQTFYYLANGF